MMKRIFTVICVLMSLLPLLAQETYQREAFVSDRGDTLLYRLLRPQGMKSERNILWYFFCTVPVNVAMTMKSNLFMEDRCS